MSAIRVYRPRRGDWYAECDQHQLQIGCPDWELALEAAYGHAAMAHPRVAEDDDQAWFWTPVWQEGEQEATADIEAGRMVLYEELTWDDELELACEADEERGHNLPRDVRSRLMREVTNPFRDDWVDYSTSEDFKNVPSPFAEVSIINRRWRRPKLYVDGRRVRWNSREGTWFRSVKPIVCRPEGPRA